MTTPADTDKSGLDLIEDALANQVHLTATHTQQLRDTSVALQDLQAQIQPLQPVVQALADQQAALARQQAEVLLQLQALTSALINRPQDSPTPHVSAAITPMVPAPVNPIITNPLPPEPSLSAPRPFDGNFETCATFIMQCELVFAHQPSMFATDSTRIAYMINLLTGRAAQWVTASWSMGASFCHAYKDFVTELRKVFHHPISGQEPGTRLSSIQQGSGSVADYSVEFRLAAAESGWNDQSLRRTFRDGLSDAIKDQLATREEPASLDELIDLSIRIDGRLRERRR
uniref:Retrotransposon gag domain-containing protein n=1 Tax=Hippocampus comes TaxID=109280 RepID=A0A3Q2YIA6_HIPCM